MVIHMARCCLCCVYVAHMLPCLQKWVHILKWNILNHYKKCSFMTWSCVKFYRIFQHTLHFTHLWTIRSIARQEKKLGVGIQSDSKHGEWTLIWRKRTLHEENQSIHQSHVGHHQLVFGHYLCKSFKFFVKSLNFFC